VYRKTESLLRGNEKINLIPLRSLLRKSEQIFRQSPDLHASQTTCFYVDRSHCRLHIEKTLSVGLKNSMHLI
jgi:hypothetical protein